MAPALSENHQPDSHPNPRPEECEACGVELVSIRMVVDGNDLVMESCQKCDIRRWHLAGKRIDLQRALAEVGEHAGRRR